MKKLGMYLVAFVAFFGTEVVNAMYGGSSSSSSSPHMPGLTEQEQLDMALALSLSESASSADRQQNQGVDDLKRAQELSLQEYEHAQRRNQSVQDADSDIVKELAKLSQAPQPIVKSLVWGACTVLDNGKEQVYKDCKLSPKGSTEWDWEKAGTRHVPGIQKADLEEFIDDVDVVILSQGMHGVLRVAPETIPYLVQKKKRYEVLLTPQAVERYAQLVQEGQRVGILIHSTC